MSECLSSQETEMSVIEARIQKGQTDKCTEDIRETFHKIATNNVYFLESKRLKIGEKTHKFMIIKNLTNWQKKVKHDNKHLL